MKKRALCTKFQRYFRKSRKFITHMKNTVLVETKLVVGTTPNFRKNHSFSKLFPCKMLIFRNTHFILLFNITDVF